MSRLKGNIWIKAVAMLLTMIMGSAALFAGVATVSVGMISSQERSLDDIRSALYWKVYSNYAAAMLREYYDAGMDDSMLPMLDGGGIRYSVVRKTVTVDMQEESDDGEQTADTGEGTLGPEKISREVIYTNDPSIDQDNYMCCFSAQWGDSAVGNVETFLDALCYSGGYWSGYYSYRHEVGRIQFAEVYMSPADTPAGDGLLNGGYNDYTQKVERLADIMYRFSKTCGIWFLVTLIAALALFVYLMRAAGRRPEDGQCHMRWLDKIPFGIYTMAAIGSGIAGCAAIIGMADAVRWNQVGVTFGGSIIFAIVVAVEFVMLAYCMSVSVRIKTKTFWRYTLVYIVGKPVWRVLRKFVLEPVKRFFTIVRTNLPMSLKVMLVFFGIALAEWMIFAMSYYDEELMLIVIFAAKFIECPLLIHILYQMKRIKEGGRRIAAGDYSHPISTDRMLWEFKQHAENINNVGNGISLAVAERMKSEHFRTELITNVSHDIKTPLTSIINYVDLIKKEEITSPTMQEYIDVLDRQSARLKKLIEDLMEASKASTGNLSVNLEVCDATVMLSQVVGEFEERAKENSLELVTEYPEPPVEIMADGRHLWRVIDNLMSNACKYGMPGTRVYISLEVFNGMVIMTFRNISKSRLNVESAELMERFVRGDSSRNTEGSGLGLSIAQSLTTLMNGNMAIQIDGDLFKAIVSFSQVVR